MGGRLLLRPFSVPLAVRTFKFMGHKMVAFIRQLVAFYTSQPLHRKKATQAAAAAPAAAVAATPDRLGSRTRRSFSDKVNYGRVAILNYKPKF